MSAVGTVSSEDANFSASQNMQRASPGYMIALATYAETHMTGRYCQRWTDTMHMRTQHHVLNISNLAMWSRK